MTMQHAIRLEASRHSQWVPAKHWCRETFGEPWDPVDNPEGCWKREWQGHDPVAIFYCFAKASDATLFRLRWL